MDKRLQALAGRQGGTFSAAQAKALAVPDHELQRAVTAGELVRVRREAYVAGAVWAGANSEERYLLTAVVVARTRPDDALSHHAALAVHELPLFGHDPSRVDVLSEVRQAVNRSGLWVHPLARAEVVVRSGVSVVTPARAIVRAALTMGRDCAVVAGDAALHRRLVTVAELPAEVATPRMESPRWSGARSDARTRSGARATRSSASSGVTSTGRGRSGLESVPRSSSSGPTGRAPTGDTPSSGQPMTEISARG